MSRYATIALCEIENFVGHATAHLDTEDQIEVYEHLIVSWQKTVREIRAEKETSPVQAVCDRAAHLADVPTPLNTWRCMCAVPLRSEDAKTPYGKRCTCDNCLGSLGALWYCGKAWDEVQRASLRR